MANIYNFGLAGVGSRVQFGKGGIQLLSNSGTLQATAADGSTLVRLQIANGVGVNDAINVGILNVVTNNFNSNIAVLTSLVNTINATVTTLSTASNTLTAGTTTLTTEVRGVEAGAGLVPGTGAYVACAVTSYLSNATSLYGADVLLDNGISTLRSTIATIETAIGLSNTAGFVAVTGSAFLANATSVANALSLLDAAANAALGAVTIEAARAKAAEANIAANVAVTLSTLNSALSNASSNSSASLANLAAQIALVQANVTANVVSLTAAIAQAVSHEATDIAATNANVVTVAANLVANVAILTSAVSQVQANITSNTSTLTTAISSETTRAIAAETLLNATLQAQITLERGDITATNANVAALSNTITVTSAGLANTIAAETTRAEAAETALNTTLTWVQTTYINKSGAVPFTGNVSLGGYNLTNLANPIANTDAVNLGYLTTVINGLGGAFTYVGVLSNAAASANTATSLQYLTGPHGAALTAGDYFKSNTAGYYVYGNAAPFYVQANDGIVFNTTGGFDVLASVQSMVLAGQFIDVTGSADTGFTVSIDPVFIADVQTLQAQAITLSMSIIAETTRASAAETSLNSNVIAETARATTAESVLNTNTISNYNALTSSISLVNAAITAETVRASTAEAGLAGNAATVVRAIGLTTTGSYVAPFGSHFLGNTTTVLAALAALDTAASGGSGSTASEVLRAEAAEANIAANVAANFSTLSAQTALVQANVSANVASLYAAIANVVANVATNYATEKADFATANANLVANVAMLTGLIGNSGGTLAANIATLSNTIGTIETSVGLSNTGSFIALSGTHFLANATTVANALVNLDGQIETVVVALNSLSQYQIITADGQAYVRVDDANGIVTALSVNGAAKPVMNVVAGPATNTFLTTDFTVANAITMTATGAAANINLRLVPKGSGQVYIGQNGAAGSMQAEPGQSLEIAGGDSTTGAGGALIMRGGDGNAGLANAGLVQITDALSQNVATFGGVANSNTYFSFLNGANAATLAISGTTSGNLVLQPLGTGSVSVSNARLINVGTGIAGTDATNVTQVNTAISNAIIAVQTGIVYTCVLNFSETSGTYAIGAAITGTVIRARVQISAVFNANTVIEVGTSAGGSDLLASSQIDGTLPNQFFLNDVASAVTNTTLYTTVIAPSMGSGLGSVLIEYIHA